MSEKEQKLEHGPDQNGLLHLARCFGQLTVMWAQEKKRAIQDALDDDPWPDDDPEAQTIRSGRW